MSINITENTVGIWFSETPDGDWLATVNAVEPEGYELVYRFRHVVDDKVFDSEDTKNWYCVRIKESMSEEKLLKYIREGWKLVSGWSSESEKYEVLMGDDTLEGFMARFTNLPCTNMKVLTPEEAKEEGYLDETTH